MKFYSLAAAATLSVASASSEWVNNQLAKYASFDKACINTPLQDAIDSFRQAVEAESWCSENPACEMYFQKGVLYFKAAHSNAEPYSCDLAFNNDLQDKFVYWSANFMDEFPDVEPFYNDFIKSQLPECWERVAADFREWEGLDITAKDFYAVAGAQSAESGDSTDWSVAANYWYDRRDKTRAFLTGELANCFDDPKGEYNNVSLRTFLKSEYEGMFKVLAHYENQVKAKAAGASTDKNSAEFMWYLSKLLDRATLLGDPTVKYFLSILPDAKNMIEMSKGPLAQVAMLQTHWDDFDFKTGEKSLDILQKLTCDSVLKAAKGAYDALEPLF